MSGAFAGERVLVVGAGVAGRAAAEVFGEEGASVVVSDPRPARELDGLDPLRSRGVEIRAGRQEAADADGVDLVFASPGVPQDVEVLAAARARGLPIVGELELGVRFVRVPYLAVTGTNGKTTATGMLAACLRAAGIDAVACGNIGRPFPTTAREPHDVLVVECSSFQLAGQDVFAPHVSVLLNIAPDHLDWHGSSEAYAAAKAAIFARQGAGDVHVGNRDDGSAEISARAPCPTWWFRAGAPDAGEVGYVDGRLVARVDGEIDLGPVDGARAGFREDAAAAATAALAFGVAPDAVAAGLAGYRPPAHRGEVVAEVDGVRFIDNSKATNVHAALAALATVDDAVLIAGGRAKGADLSPLATRAASIRAVVAIGEAADAVVGAFDGVREVRRAATIEDAVAVAAALAAPGGTVLLAPACASWDMFASYEERGDRFAAAARRLAPEAGGRGAEVGHRG